MSELKSIVQNSLELKNVSPVIISSIDTLLRRAIVRLHKNDILPPRVMEFISADKKNQRDFGDATVNYYVLPEDFRAHEEFYVYDSKPYFWVDDDKHIHKRINADREEINPQRQFTIVNQNFDSEDKGQKWLVAFPFPDDDATIRLKYYPDGSGGKYEWISQEYWEVVIAEVESIIGLNSQDNADHHRAKAVGQWKKRKGTNSNQAKTTLKATYFGGFKY